MQLAEHDAADVDAGSLLRRLADAQRAFQRYRQLSHSKADGEALGTEERP